MTNPAAVAALRAQIASKIRAIHHYGTPPDARLVEDVESDVRDILEDVQALLDGAALEAPLEPSETAIAVALNVCPERFKGVQPYGGVMEPMLAPEQIAVMLRAAYSVDFGVRGVVPAPAPDLAALLCETAPSTGEHSWYMSDRQKGNGPCSHHIGQAARLAGRVFVGRAVPAPQEGP